MKIDRDSIQRLLDGEVPPEEREMLLRQVMNDPAAKRDYDELRAVMDLMESEGPREAPPGFTASVMARLPERAPSLGERIRSFLFGDRVLRWNMASALAIAAMLAAVILLMRPGDLRMAKQPAGEGVVTVRLSFYAPQARQVAVAGDFNKWTVGSDLMDRRDGGLWTIDLTLLPGRYAYMFVLDGSTWVADPEAESFQDDGFGSTNAVMRIRT